MRFLSALVLSLLLCAPVSAQSTATPPEQRPSITAEGSFGRLIARLSEPGGFFDTDNLISNESSYLHVVGAFKKLGVSGGAYIGVGPDQNFSYIAAIRPRIAIIIDIRRDNMLQQLLFKALFTLAHNRAEYLAALFGRPTPAGRTTEWSVERLLEYIEDAPARQPTFDSAHAAVQARIRGFGVPLSEEDFRTIRRFHVAFYESGPELRFESFNRAPQPYYPTYRQLLEEKDLEGRQVSYLASEERFRVVQALQARNRVIPVVGDLAGERALAAIARYLREQNEKVSAYYTSNVEFYLTREAKMRQFVDNVRELPYDRRSVIIRSYFGRFRNPHPQAVAGYASTQLLQPIEALLREYDAGRIRSYFDLVTVGSLPLR